MSQIFSDNICSFNCFNWFNKVTPSDERSAILAWLSPIEPRIRHQAVRTDRVPNVGEWLLQEEVFQKWCDVTSEHKSDNSTIFCYGDPGIGKTYITSLVIDTLGEQASEKDIVVACFYFDFATQKQQSPTNVLGALLRQVVNGLDKIPEEISAAFHRNKRVAGGQELGRLEIVKMFQTVSSSSFKRTFICVDALDECEERHLPEVLSSLQEIIEKSPGTRLFLTGRQHIRSVVKRLLPKIIIMWIKPSKADIITYITASLENDTYPEAMKPSLKHKILTMIPATASEIFLLVSLVIKATLEAPTVADRIERLEAMDCLRAQYDKMLDRIRVQGGGAAELGMAALMWICHSEIPFGVDDLRHALAVQEGSTTLNEERVPDKATLLKCCQGLFSVDGDEAASTVRLIHVTFQDYLSTHPDFVGKAHSKITETCLTFLNFEWPQVSSTSNHNDAARIPFLKYSSIFWGTHAQKELSPLATSLALKLFRKYENHISTKLFLEHILDPDCFKCIKTFSPFTGLHFVSFFGIAKVAIALIDEDGFDVNQKDCVGNTPLVWAAGNGHEEIVELLLANGDIDPNLPDIYDQAPSWWAAKKGHEGVMKVLRKLKAITPEIQVRDRSSHSPLPHANSRKRKRVDIVVPPARTPPAPQRTSPEEE